MTISPDITENLKVIKERFANCYDLMTRKISPDRSDRKILAIYFDTLIDKEWAFDNIIKPLNKAKNLPPSIEGIKTIEESVLETAGIEEITTYSELLSAISLGNIILLYDSSPVGLAINIPGWKLRSIEEPQGEVVVTGPKEGFIETLNINVGLLRRRFRTDNFKAETLTAGKTSQSSIAIIYLEDIVNMEVLQKVRTRLAGIKTDIILDTSHVEQLIEDENLSPFPQLVKTERPDRVAIGLNQGRVAIMMEGSPHALLVPGLFLDFLHSVEDYYHRFYFSLAIRGLRYVLYAVALLLPALYIAITTYHQEMIPTPLLITLTSSRTGVPFPALIEALLMEVVFEALREAGLRLPKAIGPAVTIVGALIIGEAAVTAGIVSQAMVIIVALTGIASFTIPGYTAAISERLLRFPIMVLAASLGLFGVLLALLILIIHLASIESFGIPYLSPLAPFSGKDIPDLLRVPLHYQNSRRKRNGNK